jgi:HD-like signal output (HDOD) protein
MKRILFVDDEPMILDGLRRMLRGMRNEWEMHFVDSGEAALALLAQTPCDVVVSDMRMPAMNGAQLLNQIKLRHPEILRIVLSGHAEADMVMQAFGVTHQYLLKPCEQGTLREAIARACRLQEALHSTRVQQVIGGIDHLPTLPATYQQLVSCLRSPDCSLAEVGRIIGDDVGMTAAILKIVNSAYFGLTKPIASIERAVTFLGLEAVMALVLEHGVFGAAQPPEVPGFDLQALRRDSLRAAAAARAIAKLEPALMESCDEAFLSGVLHDVGTLALALYLPGNYVEVGTHRQQHGVPWHEAERAVIGVSHAEAGAYLLGLWGFQNPVLEAILFHETPEDAPTSGISLVTALHVGHAIASHPERENPADLAPELRPGYLERVGALDRWPAWREACLKVLTETA